MRRKWISFLKIAIVVYCLVGITIYYMQDRIFFRPEPVDKDHQYDLASAHREINIPYAPGENMNIVQFTAGSKPRGVVLYFHGNKKNIERYAPAAPDFTSQQFEVWMIDYPGFGKSTGEFKESRLYDWALVFYQLARARFSPDSIIIYGKSLGTGIASQLASVRDCRYLLLETPYYSLPSLIDAWLPIYPTHNIIQTKFPTYEHLQNVTAPVVIWHGTADWTVPIRNARRLLPFLKTGDRFITIEDGKHNDLRSYPEYKTSLDSLLNR